MYQDKTLQRLAIIALILALSVIFVAHAAAETIVSVDAPEYVRSDTFNIEIKIKDVYELDSGEFHLLFDPNVVDVTDVTAGGIGNMNIGFTNKRSDKIQGIGIIKVTFDISGTDGVSGSGSLATVGFDATGSDGTCSILNIFNPNRTFNPITDFYEGGLWDGSTIPITAKWENDIVCIGEPSSFDDPPDSGNSIDSNTSTPDTPETKVSIFVENRDDDTFWVQLFIDGAFDKNEKIKKDETKEYYDGRRLTDGVHTFEIRWHDPDTDKDYVKTEEHNVIGETVITLRTDEYAKDNDSTDSNISTPETKAIIYVENRDDDTFWVQLFIDGTLQENKYKLKKDETKEYYDGRRLTDGVHTFEIRWHDPDTDKDYVKTEEHNVIGETVITLRTDEYTKDDVDKLSAHVYVKNLDDDDLDEIYLYIDGVYWKCKSTSSGSTGDYGKYEFEEDEDTLHSFKIEWFDPGTDVTYEKIVRSYITGEEAVTLYVDKHTKEDIILLSEATSTPVSTIPSSSTSTRTAKEPTPSPTKTQITELHTDPALTQASSEGGDMVQHLSATCTLLAFVAVLFVLMQIRRI